MGDAKKNLFMRNTCIIRSQIDLKNFEKEELVHTQSAKPFIGRKMKLNDHEGVLIPGE